MSGSIPQSLRSFQRLVLILAVACTAGIAAACADDDPSGPAGSLAGVWEDESGFTILRITASRVNTYFRFSSDDCYDFEESLEIISRDGDEYTLRDEDDDEFEIEADRDGDELTITEDGATTTFFLIDDGDFDECD